MSNAGAEMYPNASTGVYTQDGMGTHFTPSSLRRSRLSFNSGTIPPTPARMCTVSHCYQILPGFYRYKRCEQHRLQNRYHSKLKRVREKVDGDEPDDKEDGVEIPRHMMENGLEIRVGEGGGRRRRWRCGRPRGLLGYQPSGKVEDQVTFSYLQLE